LAALFEADISLRKFFDDVFDFTVFRGLLEDFFILS
jgi:hypothetical protein